MFAPLRAAVATVRPRAALQVRTAYTSVVIEHYENPKNVGALDKSKKSVGTGLVGAPACGTYITSPSPLRFRLALDAKELTLGFLGKTPH